MEFKMYMVFVSGLIPLLIGAVWYNPKVFGTAWMNALGYTEKDLEGANMPLIFGLSYLFAVMLSLVIAGFAIHQFSINGFLQASDMSKAGKLALQAAMELNTDVSRNFGHGAFHGVLFGIFVALPILATNAMFQRLKWKLIWINAGYWIVCTALMGGFLCQFM